MNNYLDVYQVLRHSLSNDSLILTPNSRLATALLDYYASHQANVFIKPAIVPYTQWLRQTLISHPQAEKTLINNQQSHELWLKLVQEQHFATGLAHDLQRAFALCQQWSITIDDSNFDFNHETQQFYHWSQEYQLALDHLDSIDESQLADYLIDDLVTLPPKYKQIIWVNFNQFTPQQQRLQQWLATQKISLATHKIPNIEKPHYQLKSDNNAEQELQLTSWLNKRLTSKDKLIGVAVADLTTSYTQIDRLLKRHFSKEQYNISMGQALTHYPLVSQALMLLKTPTQAIESHLAKIILTSPYLADAESERNARFQALSKLKCLQQPRVKLSSFINQLKSLTPKLYKTLSQFEKFKTNDKLSPSQWALKFKQLLHNLGYPGEQGLNSEQYQCFIRFEKSIDELIHYDRLHPQLTYLQAINLLERHCSNTLFQPQNTSATIHVLGLLEASGLHFDSLWVMNMTEHTLPNPVKLSPFIPYTIQKQLQMPYSNHQHELDYATKLIQGLIQHSDETIFSYTQFNEDLHCNPCVVIKDYPHFASPLQVPNQEYLDNQLIIEQEYLAIEEQEQIKGGTFLLKEQALCPFRAFVKYRLHAKPQFNSSEGLSPLDRGTLIHSVLELIWTKLKSQQTLLSLSEQQVTDIICECVELALIPLIKQYPDRFTPQFKSIENSRLINLCRRWLELEKQRPPFEVDSLEQQQSIHLNNLTISMRVDRIDKLENGDKLVIDYKNTSPSPNEWFDTRPAEPQLPLYSLCDEEISALTFAQLKSSDLKFNGISNQEIEIKHIKPLEKSKSEFNEWEQQRQQWLSYLTQLADEFQQGEIRISPKKSSVCQQCDFTQVCRIHYNN